MTNTLKRNRTARLLLALTLAVLLVPTAAPAKKKKKKGKRPAENEAVVVGTVVNQQEETIAEARVTVTSAEAPDFRAEATADKKGLFSVRVMDPVGDYVFKVEAEGYAVFEAKTPLTPGEEAHLGFTLLDAAAGAHQTAVLAFNAGVQAFNKNDLATAKASFLEATGANPEMIEPYQGLAEIYYREKNYEEAAAAADKVLAAKPGDPSVLTLAYTAHRELGNHERTEELIDALAKTNKAKPIARQIYNEGVAASQKGDNEKALERFARASSLDPELAPAYSSQATILYNEARYGDAEAVLEKLFALAPEDKQGRRIGYLIYDAQDDQAKAAEALDAYLAVDADGAVDLMYQRADLDFRDNNHAKAIVALERILELRPEMPRAHYTLGLCHMSGDKAKAKVHLEKFVELAPDDPEVPSAKEILEYLK